MSRFILLIAILTLCVCSLYSQGRSDLFINYTVHEVSHFALTSNQLTFNMRWSGTPGLTYRDQFLNVSYEIACTGERPRKLSASLERIMNPGVTIWVKADPPSGATARDYQALDTTNNTHILTNIKYVNQSGLLLWFKMTADIGAKTGDGDTIIKFTLTAD